MSLPLTPELTTEAKRPPGADLPAPIDLLGVRVHPLTVPQLHDAMGHMIDSQAHALVLNVNAHCLNLAAERPWLRDFLNSAGVVFCDGAGVMLGARLLGQHIPERITYADWFWQLAEWCVAHGHSLYFLGAQPGVAAQAAERLQERFPALQVVGCHDGYFDTTPGSPANQDVIRQINAVRPNILVVGFGMPKQEQWLLENWAEIDANIALTGGAVFDYISGNLARAPRWMTDNGLEWLGRMVIEPGRLWKRYVLGNPAFLWRIGRQRLSKR